MPSINDLVVLKQIRSDLNSDLEFRRLLDLWEDHIAPVIVKLARMAGTKPQPSSFDDSKDFEEAFGF